MSFKVKRAVREQVWTKVALMGPSGSGKTYSALRLATGMLEKLRELGQEQNDRILMVNTEASRGLYYADEFEYDITKNFVAPYKPERYIEAIEYAIEEKYPILILDSTSHEWMGEGGVLELVEKAGGFPKGWASITPRHRKFIEKIADSPIHIIATMRGKDQYELDRDDEGHLSVQKLGIGPEQKKDTEYEFTVAFLLEQATNTAQSTKDNTHIFDGSLAMLLSEKEGRMLIEWANSEKGFTVPVRRQHTKKEISEFAKKQGLQPTDIPKAFEQAGTEWSGDPDKWDIMKDAITTYKESLEKIGEA
jgi:hypothetical protein